MNHNRTAFRRLRRTLNARQDEQRITARFRRLRDRRGELLLARCVNDMLAGIPQSWGSWFCPRRQGAL